MMDNFGYVFATKMLVEGKRKVRFMYREQPDGSNDSGWRFFCGDETLPGGFFRVWQLCREWL